MANRSDLEAQEKQCKSVEDWVALAAQAMSDPPDADYAKSLLQKAESQCQMPLDYLKPADFAASRLGDREYALDLYTQAEDMCFEPAEFAAVARSLAVHGGGVRQARAGYAEHGGSSALYGQPRITPGASFLVSVLWEKHLRGRGTQGVLLRG